MKKLNEKEWKDFELQEIFPEIKSTKGVVTSGLVKGDDLPYIAAAKSIVNCQVCSSEANGEWRSAGNGMVFVQLGDGAAGLAHYMPIDFIGMSGKTSVGYSKKLNSANGIFISRCLSSNKAIFSHGHSWTGRRLRGSRNMLPINENDEPDYTYMEKYTTKIKTEKIEKYKSFIAEMISELKFKDIPSLEEKDWEPFSIDSFADVKSGRDIYANDRIDGQIPYITSGTSNNGIGYFVGNINESMASNAISVNRNGSVGEAFYHPYGALYGNDCRRVELRNFRNKWVQLFLTLVISKQKSAFSYSRKLGTVRLKQLQVMLPINENKEPDFLFMEQYIRNLVLRKYEQYNDFLSSK